jgi:hypothetical protein
VKRNAYERQIRKWIEVYNHERRNLARKSTKAEIGPLRFLDIALKNEEICLRGFVNT